MNRSPPLEIHKPKRPKKPMPYDKAKYDGSDSGEPIEAES
jgi:hypothetical protein